MKNILGLDLGTTTLGIAISHFGTLVSGYETFNFKRDRYDLALLEVKKIVEKEKVEAIVIGYPLHLSGQVSPMALLARGFAGAIEDETGIKVELVDERMSTLEASRILHDQGYDAYNAKPVIDEMAAKIILETYLNKLRVQRQNNEE